MGDAVRRVQKHLQELSRDHLTSVEDRHHANLGWLQIELQQLCKQIEVEVRVELTRPPRLSFSKPNALPLTAARDSGETQQAPAKKTSVSTTQSDNSTTAGGAASSSARPRVLPSPVHAPATRLLDFELIEEKSSPRASKKRRLENAKKSDTTQPVTTKNATAITHEVIDIDGDSDFEVLAVVPPGSKRMVTRVVKRTRKVLKPKRIVKTEKKLIKEQKPRLPQVDVEALKVVDLKSELKKRGLKQTGVKAVLAVRLQEALNAEDAAKAQDDDDDGKWVTEEVVEEIMEEVEEEYEEEVEVEEVVDDVISNAVEDPVRFHPAQNDVVDQVAGSKEPTGILATGAASEAAVDVAANESERMSAEDRNARTGTDRDQVAEASSAATQAETNPKPSLSDMVAPMTDDEIVRESADGFISPEGKVPPASGGKSSGREVPSPRRLDTIVEATPKAVEASSVTQMAKATSANESGVGVSAVPRPQSEPGRQVGGMVPAEKTDEGKRPTSAPHSSGLVGSQQAPQTHDKTALSVPFKTPSEPQNIQPASSRTVTSAEAAPQLASGVVKEDMTPSRDLRERVRYLTSSRSSSSSSSTAPRRYTGSISYVEDSQPSPLQSTFTTDFSTQSTRAGSVSHVEIESFASKAKTPDPVSSVPPPSERVAQSEPRITTAKLEVEDEATRKRREQEENIQREAQRLRMVAKQSAKKRFEESKTTALFWKRDATGEDQAETISSAEPRQADQTSNSVSSVHDIVDVVTPKTGPPAPVSDKESSNVDKAITGGIAEDNKEAPLAKASVAPAAPVNKEKSNPSLSRSQPPPSAPVAKKEPEKRVVPTRKRSSIVLDSSASTLYPSKKRTSLVRSKDAEPVVKRASLTRSTPPAESARAKRSSTERIPPAENVRKRTSTERMPVTTEALKRKRSSGSLDQPVVVTTSGKRKSIASNQPGQPGSRAQAPTASSLLKTSAASTKSGIPSSTAAKRRDSASSTISSSSSVSTSDVRSKPSASVFSGGAVRKPANLVSGIHSFTTLLEKDSANLSSSQGSTGSRQAPSVGALKMAEKSRLLEQKKALEKAKRKEALAKRYEEQRKADEEKRKKYALMKEKAEREARSKREQDQAAEKKQRDMELAKKRQQRLQEIRSGMEKKKTQGTDKDQATASKTVAPVSRVAGAPTSASTAHSVKSSMKAPLKPSENKELMTYVMSENEESSGSEDEKDTERNSKNIPKWAQRENLERALRIQFGPNAVDPTPSIFPDFVDTCDLEAIFEPTDVRKKKRFQRRTSSGNWLGDRPTAREKAVYKKDMGFSR